jgi:hypothetical protein
MDEELSSMGVNYLAGRLKSENITSTVNGGFWCFDF